MTKIMKILVTPVINVSDKKKLNFIYHFGAEKMHYNFVLDNENYITQKIITIDHNNLCRQNK